MIEKLTEQEMVAIMLSDVKLSTPGLFQLQKQQQSKQQQQSNKQNKSKPKTKSKGKS